VAPDCPFWVEKPLKSRTDATQSSLKRLFQAFNASFRSLGLVFAFSPYQRFTRARDPGPAPDRLASKEVNQYP
jgi:hypothetical protein